MKIWRQTTKKKEEFYQDDEIVAYSADMKPLTKKQYIKEIEDAIAEVDRGEFITDEEYFIQRKILTN